MEVNVTERAVAIRAVLFDFGGVLAEEGFREGLYALAREQGLNPIAVHRAAFEAVYTSGYVMGRGTETDFWQFLQRMTGLKGENSAMSQAILSRFELRPRMLDIVRSLRQQGYITGILSDQSDWLDRLDSKLHFFHTFDKIYNSYHVGKGKRDPSIFDDVLADLDLVPSEVLFVDDDPSNVERARSRGLQGLLFRHESQFLNDLQAILGHHILES